MTQARYAVADRAHSATVSPSNPTECLATQIRLAHSILSGDLDSPEAIELARLVMQLHHFGMHDRRLPDQWVH